MTGKKGIIRVLIADDHPIVCMGLAAMIATQPDMELVGEASDGLEAIQLFKSERPDVTLMDLRMPNCGGVPRIQQTWQDLYAFRKGRSDGNILPGDMHPIEDGKK